MIEVEDIKKIQDSLPDEKINPTGEDSLCLYVDKDDPTWHCIAGEIFARLGFDDLANERDSNRVDFLLRSTSHRDEFSEEARVYLDTLQGFADSATYAGYEYAWGFAKWAIDKGKKATFANMRDLLEEYKEESGHDV